MSHDQQPPYPGQHSPGPHPPGYPQGPGAPAGNTGSNDTLMASAAHWGPLVVNFFTGFVGFVVPLVIMTTVGNRSPFVRAHAVESLNFQISLAIYLVGWLLVSMVLGILTLGLGLIVLIPLLLVWAIALLVFSVIASIKAANGEPYRYPLILRFVS